MTLISSAYRHRHYQHCHHHPPPLFLLFSSSHYYPTPHTTHIQSVGDYCLYTGPVGRGASSDREGERRSISTPNVRLLIPGGGEEASHDGVVNHGGLPDTEIGLALDDDMLSESELSFDEAEHEQDVDELDIHDVAAEASDLSDDEEEDGEDMSSQDDDGIELGQARGGGGRSQQQQNDLVHRALSTLRERGSSCLDDEVRSI